MAVGTVLVCGAALLVVAALPALLAELITHHDNLFAGFGRVMGRQPPEPVGPPIEALSAQLRRLSAVLTQDGPVSSVRRFGVERAYDETLVRACDALGVPQQLSHLDLTDRGFERLRVESQLQELGLVVRAPRPRRTS